MARSINLPFRFAGRDLAGAEGHRLRVAQVRNVALTEPGELPWRSRFGAGLNRLRHRRLDDVLVELLRVSMRDSLGLWAPSLDLAAITTRQDGEELHINLVVGHRQTGETVKLEFTL